MSHLFERLADPDFPDRAAALAEDIRSGRAVSFAETLERLDLTEEEFVELAEEWLTMQTGQPVRFVKLASA